MKVVSFNVNGLRARLHQLEAVIKKHQPDVIGLQEIKVHDDEFPLADIEALGYRVAHHGQKGHYGVAILSKQLPVTVQKGFPGEAADAQRRFISADFQLEGGSIVQVINGYFPQGENRDHPEKFPAKEAYYSNLLNYLKSDNCKSKEIVLIGDMNVAPADADVGIGEVNAKRWLRTGKCCFLPEERQWLSTIFDTDLHDTFRTLYPEVDDLFSWFDYRSKGFADDPKRGLRIDLILASSGLLASLVGAEIDYEVREMVRPSDHAPIVADFSVNIKLN